MTKPTTNKYASSQAEQISLNSTKGNRKLFENDAYESISQSLFATAKSCHQANGDASTTQHKLLETFHAGLMRLNQSVDEKLNKK